MGINRAVEYINRREECDARLFEKKEDGRFLRPEDLVDRTRKALQIAATIDEIQDDLEVAQIARQTNLEVSEIMDIADALFLIPQGAFNRFVNLCRQREFEFEIPEVPDEIDEVLMESMIKNAPHKNSGVAERIRSILKRDLYELIESFMNAGTSLNHVLLNRYSPYYRKYGLKLYLIYFGTDMEELTGHDNPHVRKELEIALNPGGHVNRNEAVAVWSRVSTDWVDDIRDLPEEELIIEVERYFGISLIGRYRERFNKTTTLKLLEFFAIHDVQTPPHLLWFTYSEKSLKKVLVDIELTLAICEEHAIPQKTINSLIKAHKNGEKLYKHIAEFEEHGLMPEYYGPYMGVHGQHLNEVVIKNIIATIAMERRLSRHRDLHYPHKEIDPIQPRRATHDRIAAQIFLDRIGHPYDSFSVRTATPEALGQRVRVFHEADLPIKAKANLGSRSLAPIQDRAEHVVEGKNEFQNILQERKIDPPQWLLDTHRGYVTAMINKIKYIEERGLAFTNENLRRKVVFWSWLNLATGELDRKIEQGWKRLHRADRWRVLGYMYDIDHFPASLQREDKDSKSPETVWRYLRIATQAGTTIDDISVSRINVTTLETWHDYLYRKIRKGNTPLNRLYREKYRLAKKLKTDYECEEAHELIDSLSEEEFHEFQKAIGGNSLPDAAELYDSYIDRLNRRERIIELLFKARASYADLEFFLDYFEVDQIEARIQVFEDLSQPIDIKLLYLTPEEIRKKLTQ